MKITVTLKTVEPIGDNETKMTTSTWGIEDHTHNAGEVSGIIRNAIAQLGDGQTVLALDAHEGAGNNEREPDPAEAS